MLRIQDGKALGPEDHHLYVSWDSIPLRVSQNQETGDFECSDTMHGRRLDDSLLS